MKQFINRIAELKTLEEQYFNDSSSFVVVYGRRRIGKTSLLRKFLSSHQESVYFLATEESEKQNLISFKKEVAQFTHNDLLLHADIYWDDVFKSFVNYQTSNKKIIVIDEFQYLGLANKAFPSILQKIWDTLLINQNIMLILCGSLISLMKSQTLDYSSPLYGRRTAQILLKQIPFKHYHEFFQDKTNDELIPFYAVTGGVPKYIELFKGYDDVYEGILNNILNRNSFLYEEPYFLLQKEVSEIGSYFSIMKAIANGNHKLSQIASCLEIKQTSLTKYLKVLMDLDLIIREVPVLEEKPEKSKSGLYQITDYFIAFWFKFIYPYLSYVEKGEASYVLNKIKEGFIQNYASFVYEEICRDKMWELSIKNTWKFSLAKVGRYWSKAIHEIDIVAFDATKQYLILGECKYTKSKKGYEIYKDLLIKGEAMKPLMHFKEIYYVIFSTSSFDEKLIIEAKNNSHLLLIDQID